MRSMETEDKINIVFVCFMFRRPSGRQIIIATIHFLYAVLRYHPIIENIRRKYRHLADLVDLYTYV